MTKEEAIEMLKSKMDGNVDTSYEWAETVRMAIEALKIDLVRCKECRFFKREECRYYIAHGIRRKPNDFCSYGKHEGDEDE